MTSEGSSMGESQALAASIVDVNVCIGPDIPSDRSTDAADVVELQNRFNIGRSFVRSSTAIRVSRKAGNQAVLELGHTDRLSAVVVASTLHLDSLAAELAAAAKAGAKAVWLEGGNWTTESEANKRLIRVAGHTGLPLLAPHRQPGDASALGRLTAGIDTPVVLVDARYPDFADVLAALDRYHNLHIETSSLGSYQAIESITRVTGPELVLYGSGAPVGTPLSPINAILQAKISDAEKQTIFGGNAARIFGLELGPTTRLQMVTPDRLFDVHGHVFPAPWEVPDQASTSLLDQLAGYGIRKQVASSVPAIMGDLETGNGQTVSACKLNPDQLGYLVANPNDVALAKDHIMRWGDSPGIVGIKIHAEGSAVPTRSSRMNHLFDVLADYGRPVKIHNAGDGWERALIEIAQKHPQLPIIIAHAGFHRPQPSSGLVVSESSNVYIELASSKADIRDARELVGSVDVERVLFGSDAPLINPAFVIGLYQDLGLEDRALQRIYWENGQKLFGDYM